MEKISNKYIPALLFAALIMIIGIDVCEHNANTQIPKTKNSTSYYDTLIKQSDAEILVIDSAELTGEMLENRNGKIIIEKVIGEVLDEEGNGKVLNNNYYICYKNTKGVKTGSIVLSYMIYNPDTNYIDDIKDRYDYILQK